MIIRPMTHARALMATFTTTDTNAPEPVQAAYDLANRIIQDSGSILSRAGDITPAIYAVLKEGRNPASDPDVQAIITARSLATEGMDKAIEAEASRHLVEAVTEHVDTVIAVWRKKFDAAAADLAAAHKVLGNVELDDTATILRQGSKSADAWASATKADKILTQIRDGLGALIRLTRTAPDNPQHRALHMLDVDLEQWQAHNLDREDITPWRAMRHGLTLSLPTPQEVRVRIQRIEDQKQAQARAEEAAQRKRSGMAA